MQLFRLMGMPDKMIAFNELPADLLEGVEMVDESRLPRHWREFVGMREKLVKIPPDRDPLTGTVRQYQPIVQKGPFSFVIDREINKDKERWGEIESYVRRTAPKDFRLQDKLEDMAKPMAADAHSEMTLEPEEVIIVPLSVNGTMPEPAVASVTLAPTVAPVSTAPQAPAVEYKCDVCDKAFDSKQGAVMHRRKAHIEAKTEAKV